MHSIHLPFMRYFLKPDRRFSVTIMVLKQFPEKCTFQTCILGHLTVVYLSQYNYQSYLVKVGFHAYNYLTPAYLES